jgi:hypothetical protein
MDRGMDASEDLLATGKFVECVFSCPACGLAGTSLVRPQHLIGKTCYGCGKPVVLTVFERFKSSRSRGGARDERGRRAGEELP